MDIIQEFDCKIDNSTKDRNPAKDNIPDMFKQYNELYGSMIHVFDSGLGTDLRRNTYQ
jgi:hypothetical protein